MFVKRLIGGLLFACALGSSHAASPGVTDTTITIGMSSPFTGTAGAYGTVMRDTISAYFAQVNKAGGVNGRKLELVALDDGYEAERTLANTKSLIGEKNAFALIGYYGSSSIAGVLPTLAGEKVPLFGGISGADALRTPVNRYMFNVRASYANETDAIVKQLVTLGTKHIAVFYQNDGFGKSGLDGITAALKKANLAPAAVATVERNSTDVAAAVKTIGAVEPQAVIMVTLGKPTAEFVRQMRKAGHSPQFMTLSPVGADALTKDLGDEARGIGISQVMPYPWDTTTPLVAEYHQAIGKQTAPNYYGLEAYAMAKLLVEGLRRAGKELTREKLVTALEGSIDLGGFPLRYSANSRNGSSFVELTVVGPGGKVMR